MQPSKSKSLDIHSDEVVEISLGRDSKTLCERLLDISIIITKPYHVFDPR